MGSCDFDRKEKEKEKEQERGIKRNKIEETREKIERNEKKLERRRAEYLGVNEKGRKKKYGD